MNLNQDIAQRIQIAIQRGEAVWLLNDFHGMSISYDATLTGVGPDKLAFRVHEYQLVCLEMTRQAILMVESLPPIVASVLSTDIKDKQVILTGFFFAEDTIGKRAVIRVQPKEPLPVRLSRSGVNQWIKADMVDISIAGIGVQGFILMNSLQDFTRRAEVITAFSLPSDNGGPGREILVRGTIANVIPSQTSSRFRIGMRINPDETARAIISKYVSQRQAEIIREIKMLHLTLTRLAGAQAPAPGAR